MSLLSIVIICYNQEEVICDCLNSLLLSDTRDVELVISDDCSLDNSVEVVRDWLSKNSSRFERTYINRLEKHNGTVGNIVSGMKFVASPFVKLIAADDWFLPESIDYMRYFCKDNNFDAAFSPICIARIVNNKYVIANDYYPASDDKLFFSLSNKEQFAVMLKHNCLKAPGAFFTLNFWHKVGLAKIPVVIMEDWAMWLEGLTLESIYVLAEHPIVVYRESSRSVSSNSANELFKVYLRDHITTMWTIGFKKKEWVSLVTTLRIICLSAMIKICLLMPCKYINIINKVRNIYNKRS